MELSTKVAYNTIIQIISKVISTILGLVAIAMITRNLGQSGFGQYTTIITILSFFGIIADLGLTLITVQMISQPDVNENKILNNLFALRLVSAFIFIGLAPLIVLVLPYEPIIKIGVALTALSFLCIALNQIFVGLFQKKLRMEKISIAEIVGRIILVIGIFWAIKQGYGLYGILLATVVGSIINFFINYIFAQAYIRLKLEFDFKVWKKIIIKSWPLAITIVLNLIYRKAATLILSIIKSQAEVGIYGAAYKVIDVLITIPFMFAGIILPILTISWAEKKADYFKMILQKSFDFMVILALPLVIGTQFLAKEIITVVAGAEFTISGYVLKILILAAGIIFIGTIFSHVIIALNKQKKIIGAYIFTSLTALAGYLIFIPKFSYLGAAWVTIYSESIISLAAFYIVWKYTKFLPNLKILFKSILASLAMVAVLYLLPAYFFKANLILIITLFIAILTYFIALYLFKGIVKKDITILLNKSG